jgi:hypothetical protein
MKKFIIAILLMFTITGAYSQNAFVTVKNTQSAPFVTVKFSQTDSTAGAIVVSDWFDASALIGQTLYLTDSLVANGARDTVNVFIQGRTLIGSQYVQFNLDTVSTIVGAITGSTSTSGITQTLLSLSGTSPEIRFRVDNKTPITNPRKYTLWLALIGNTTNYLRDHKTYGNLP